jgi:Lon-like protease
MLGTNLDTNFDDAPPPPRRRGAAIGWPLVVFALVGITVVALLPAPYVIEQPGPVFNTLGDVTIGGDEVPMIQIPLEETFPTEGELNLLTVSVRGNREQPPSWFEVASAYFDSSRAVLPVDSVYPIGESVEDSNEQGRVDMANSQREAIAAALTNLGYDFASTLTVVETIAGAPADGLFLAGDVVLTLNGETFPDVTGLRSEIAKNGTSTPADVVVLRDGQELAIEITPKLGEGDEPTPAIGIVVESSYDFPFDVEIQLESVGGPSAGMMFALGIIDKLTPDALTGGENIAGTGTISAEGSVGAIGGIRQKMYGALDAGAEWFLAPESNCDEVTGNIPDGLVVFSVETLDDALEALETIASGADTSRLATCPTS